MHLSSQQGGEGKTNIIRNVVCRKTGDRKLYLRQRTSLDWETTARLNGFLCCRPARTKYITQGTGSLMYRFHTTPCDTQQLQTLACTHPRQALDSPHSLQCGWMWFRVMTASMLPCGSLVATYTSSSNCIHGKQHLSTLAD